VVDEQRECLDFFGGILTTSTGYKTPEVVKAIQEQAKMLHTDPVSDQGRSS
jgi:4-aminobutyrate aminotransferase-like enzyme